VPLAALCREHGMTFEDVKQNQRFLKILAETERIMQTITMELGGGREL